MEGGRKGVKAIVGEYAESFLGKGAFKATAQQSSS